MTHSRLETTPAYLDDSLHVPGGADVDTYASAADISMTPSAEQKDILNAFDAGLITAAEAEEALDELAKWQ